jgi:predicted RNase H-like nuclease (RuvC/YqgF family)
MAHSSSAASAVTEKNMIGLSVLFLVLAAIFGALNSHKVRALRANVANAEAVRRAIESRSATQQRNLKAKEMTATGEGDKVAEAENRAAKAEEQLGQLRKEKADLQTRLDANQSEITSLQKQVEEEQKAAKPAETPAAGVSAAELQAQLDDARGQLDSA